MTAGREVAARALEVPRTPRRRHRSKKPVSEVARVLRELAVLLADGGDCLNNLAAHHDPAELFGGAAYLRQRPLPRRR